MCFVRVGKQAVFGKRKEKKKVRKEVLMLKRKGSFHNRKSENSEKRKFQNLTKKDNIIIILSKLN